MVRTAILEHRPVSIVSRAMDVLVSSYSQSVKTGTLVKGVKGDKIPPRVPHDGGPRSNSDASKSKVNAHGESLRHEHAVQQETESLNRSSAILSLDTEEKIDFTSKRTELSRADFPGSSSAESHPSSSLSESLGTSYNQLNVNIPEDQDTQLTSPIISPDEIFSFVFAPVEEEMVGDPSYLVAIIIEYLRRYLLSSTLYLFNWV